MFETPTIAEFLAQSNLASTLPGTLLLAWTLILVLADLFAGEERQHWTPLTGVPGPGPQLPGQCRCLFAARR